MIKKTGRGTVKTIKVKANSIKKEPPASRNMLIVAFAVIVLVIAVSFRNKEKVPPPLPQSATSETGGAGTENAPTAKENAKQQQTVPATRSESAALMTQIRVTPENPRVGDTIKINEVVPGSEEGAKLPYTYEWRKNGEKLEETSNSLALVDGFKRGDRIEVTVTFDDGKGKKSSWDCRVSISNSPPEVVSATDLVKIDGNRFSFQVKAKDADGDPLAYFLKSSIEGATIDQSTGKVVFTVPEGRKGKVPVVVSASDGNGGEATYSFEMTLDVGKPQAK